MGALAEAEISSDDLEAAAAELAELSGGQYTATDVLNAAREQSGSRDPLAMASSIAYFAEQLNGSAWAASQAAGYEADALELSGEVERYGAMQAGSQPGEVGRYAEMLALSRPGYRLTDAGSRGDQPGRSAADDYWGRRDLPGGMPGGGNADQIIARARRRGGPEGEAFVGMPKFGGFRPGSGPVRLARSSQSGQFRKGVVSQGDGNDQDGLQSLDDAESHAGQAEIDRLLAVWMDKCSEKPQTGNRSFAPMSPGELQAARMAARPGHT